MNTISVTLVDQKFSSLQLSTKLEFSEESNLYFSVVIILNYLSCLFLENKMESWNKNLRTGIFISQLNALCLLENWCFSFLLVIPGMEIAILFLLNGKISFKKKKRISFIGMLKFESPHLQRNKKKLQTWIFYNKP